MNKNNIDKLASEALEVYKRIKEDEEKLNILKEKIIDASKGKNTSYEIKLKNATIRVIKSKAPVRLLLNREDFSKVSIDIKKDLIKKGVIKVGYSLNSSKYRDLLSKDLIPSELEDAVKKYDRKSFYISFRDVKLK